MVVVWLVDVAGHVMAAIKATCCLALLKSFSQDQPSVMVAAAVQRSMWQLARTEPRTCRDIEPQSAKLQDPWLSELDAPMHVKGQTLLLSCKASQSATRRHLLLATLALRPWSGSVTVSSCCGIDQPAFQPQSEARPKSLSATGRVTLKTSVLPTTPQTPSTPSLGLCKTPDK
jgi:hypothetical protein